MKNKRIIVAANRLPVTITTNESGFQFRASPGGLASALSSLSEKHELVWLGWPGELDPQITANQDKIKETLLAEYNARPIFLNRRQLQRYYFGFSNRVLWPVLHYMPVYVQYDERDFKVYREVNRIFADEIVRVIRESDQEALVWIHDYQLMLAPAMIRQQVPNAKIGFFLHTPFPSSEMFRTLPYREELLQGLLGASLIGFHTYNYLRHFRSSLLYILGVESEINRIDMPTHQVCIGVFPISVDVERIRKILEAPEHESELQAVRRITHGRKMILSVDRLDYTKGIPERLLGFKKFLQKNPQLINDVVLVQIAVPSRTRIPDYQRLRDRVEQSVMDIEESFDTANYPPILFMYRSLPFHRLCAFYALADVAIVTPYFDGMNLVAKEYVTVRQDDGVLILSENAGAAAELGEALIINPWNSDQIHQSLETAFALSPMEKNRRMTAMVEKVSRNNVHYWANSFLDALEEMEMHAVDAANATIPVSDSIMKGFLASFCRSKKRLILLDYDGTLAEITSLPINARPDQELLSLLRALSRLPDTDVIIVTGRNRREILEWLPIPDLGFSTGHGLWIKFSDEEEWHRAIPDDFNFSWYDIVKQIFHQFNLRTPGSFTEEKEASIAWHYRLTDPNFGRRQSRELVMHLNEVLANQPLEVLVGKMVVEVRVQGIHKGNILHRLAELNRNYDFILSIGDDVTDEALFNVLPEHAISIRVGSGVSRARYRLNSVAHVRNFLTYFPEATLIAEGLRES